MRIHGSALHLASMGALLVSASAFARDAGGPAASLMDSWTDLGPSVKSAKSSIGEGWTEVPKPACLEDSWINVRPMVKRGSVDMSQSLIEQQQQQFSSAAQPVAAMDPMVQEQDGKISLSKNFSPETYAQMAHLSYELVKGCNASSTKLLEKFQGEGWKITGFSGLSGKDERNTDLAGFVAYSPKTGEAVITFHGSQDPADWENNLDAQMLFARELGFKFDGRVSKGFAERYKSLKEGLYGILDRLHQMNPEMFHITTTGHSLGGGMAELSMSDLVTDFALKTWGSDYDNAVSNRIRAYTMSAPIAYDLDAAAQVQGLVGKGNWINDAVETDPVHYLSGETTVRQLRNLPRMVTKLILGIAKWKNKVKMTDPETVANLYGKGYHPGYQAHHTAAEARGIFDTFNDVDVQTKMNQASWWKRFKQQMIGRYAASAHYGSNQVKQDGSDKLTQAFDPRFIKGDTVASRIERSQKKAAEEKAAAEKASQAKSWWKFW